MAKKKTEAAAPTRADVSSGPVNMTPAKNISLQNVGPIEKLEIPLPAAGVVVLKGNNGSGKSTAMAATETLLGADAKALSVRDGSLKGKVEGFGVTVHLNRARNTKTGELTAIKIEHKLDLAGFIDPGIGNPEAADRARIKALASLSGAKVDLSMFWPLFGGEEAFTASVNIDDLNGRDLIETAAFLKRRLESLARESEKVATEQMARAEALRHLPEGLDLTAEHDAGKLDKSRDDATALVAELETRAKAAGQSRKRIEEAKAKAGEAATAADPEETGLALSLAESDRELAECEVSKFREHLANAQRILDERTGKKAIAQAAHDQAVKFAADREKLLAIVNAGEVAGPTIEDLRNAAELLQRSRKAVTDGALIRDFFAKKDKANSAEELAKRYNQEALDCRNNAARTDAIVSEAIQAPGLRIEDGRLVTDTKKRGATYFGELSHGERTKIALNLGVARVGAGGLLVLQQEFWEGLDGDARGQINEAAKGLGVIVLTAEASDGPGEDPIHAEMFGDKLFKEQPNIGAMK